MSDEHDQVTTLKLPVAGTMRVNVYSVLSDCVERGVEKGWRKAHKHSVDPSEEALCRRITDMVIAEICDYFDFHDQP